MKSSIFAIILLLTISVRAQIIEFINVYGNGGYDYGRDIKECHDSSFIVTGSSSSFTGEADAYLMKVDKYGDFVWSYNYGGNDSDWGQSVEIIYDSSYAIAGFTNSFGYGGFDFYLIRTDNSGIPLWEKTYGGSDWDQAYDLIETPDSGFVLVGYSYSFSGSKDGFIVRTDKNGDTLWTKIIGGTEEDFLNAVIIDGDSIVVCGGTNSFGMGGTDGLIAKMDFNGNIGWTKYVGSFNNDYFTSITSHSNYYALGGVRGYNYSSTGDDMWHFKITDDGLSTLYDTTYLNYSPADDGVNDVGILTLTGDIVYIGQTKSWGYLTDGLSDIFLGKYSSTYTSVTANNYGEEGDDIGFALDVCKDYGIVFVGDSKFYSTGGNNIIIIKISYLWNYPNQFTDLTFNNITTSIESNDELDAISIYPNPAQNLLNVTCSEKIISATIYSLDGKKIGTVLTDSNQMEISYLKNGTYVLEINTESGSYNSLFIKN
jgi:hypothetical protein